MQKPWDLRERTMDFAVAVFRLCRELPRTDEAREVARQLRRSASSVAANYRSAKRPRSSRDFAAKVSIVIEEADESLFWLEFLVRVGLAQKPHLLELSTEANELVAIFIAAAQTARGKAKSHS
jgi:four helix bundle protein